MKLYDVPKHSKIKILDENIFVPFCATPLKQNQELYFDHIDGMYSYCLDENKLLVHPSAYTEVEIIPK